MSHKNFITLTTAIFSLVALLHLLRIVWSSPVLIGGWEVPMWQSWPALIIAGYLAYQGFKISKKS